jgi:hypothetical protein
MEQHAALNFEEKILGEWTDGKLVLRAARVTCNGEQTDLRTYLFAFGREPAVFNPMRCIHGRDNGPKSEQRHWTPGELASLMQRWLDSIPVELVDDHAIVSAVEILLRGALPTGATFFKENMHSEILSSCSKLINYYTILNQRPLLKQD